MLKLKDIKIVESKEEPPVLPKGSLPASSWETAKRIYPNIRIETYSPPYKPEFSEEENRAIIEAINRANPDLL